MTRIWKEQTAQEKEAFGRAFGVAHAIDEWLDPMPAAEAAAPAVPLSVLVEAASNPALPLSATLSERLRDDAQLAEDFGRLLDRLSLCVMPRAAAASSGTIDRREARGYVIRLRPSRAEAAQINVLIDLPESGSAGASRPPPSVLIVRQADGSIIKQALQPPSERTILLIVEAQSPVAAALADPASQINFI